MNSKICTSIEQSKKLMELGIDMNTADMMWTALNWQETEYYMEVKNKGFDMPKKYIPAWSLAALLNILDYPQLSKDKLGSGKIGWMVSVYPDNCRYDSCWHDNPIDCCVEMIVKLKELNLL